MGIDDQLSAWELETKQTNYDINKFYTRASNDKGFEKQVRLNLPPDLLARMSEVVAKRQVKQYNSVQDVIRDAIVHRLAWVSDQLNDDDIARTVQHEIRAAHIEQIANEMKSETKAVRVFKEALATAAFNKDGKTITRLLQAKEADLADVPEPYRSQCLSIVEEYRHHAS